MKTALKVGSAFVIGLIMGWNGTKAKNWFEKKLEEMKKKDDPAESAAQAVADVAETAKDKAAETVDAAKDKAAEVVDAAKEKAGDAAQAVADELKK